MPHCIEAIITKENPSSSKLEILDLPVFRENGFNIVPLDSNHTFFWGQKWGVYDMDGEHFGGVNLHCLRSLERIAQEIEVYKFSIIATAYHGGIGEQAALVYENNQQIRIKAEYYKDYFGNDVTHISSALNHLGVLKKGSLDEFDTINLSKYRGFEKYFRKYEF